MVKFTPRLTLPESGNVYYNRPLNPCIIGNYPYGLQKRTGYPGLNVLPNCVGWAVARFNEIGGYGQCKWLGSTDAKNFVKLAKKQGLKTGQTPKAGAIMVWADATYGHVAVVEEVISKTQVRVSQSGWNYKNGAFWTAVHEKGDGSWTDGDDKPWMKGYTFLAFIYHPDVYELPKGAEWIKVKVEGKGIVEVPATNLNGNWYIMLRAFDDLMQIAKVDYDEKNRLPIIID